MKFYARRAALAQNARLYGGFNSPDRKCECGALDSEHDDHGDPFTDSTKTCSKTGCTGFFEMKCECRPCPGEFCKDGMVPVMEAIRFNKRGEPCAWDHNGEWLPCVLCHGTGKNSEDCLMHGELTALELITMGGGR